MRDVSKRAARRVLDLCEPTTVLPSQYGEIPGCHRIPEMHLVAAILEDALHCIAHYAHTRSGRRRRDFLDAYQWVWKDQKDWPFAFSGVCELLGLEPAAVRQFVQRLVATAAQGEARCGVYPEERRPTC
jgi:hypothetical protein